MSSMFIIHVTSQFMYDNIIDFLLQEDYMGSLKKQFGSKVGHNLSTVTENYCFRITIVLLCKLNNAHRNCYYFI